MPIRYNISPELNMVIYVCRGSITAAEIFETADMVFHDERRKPGLITILDLLRAVENIHLKDIYEAIERIAEYREKGLVAGPTVLLSLSNGIHVLVATLNLLPSKVPFTIKACHSMEDAIVYLGLLERRQEIIQFWHESNTLYEKS